MKKLPKTVSNSKVEAILSFSIPSDSNYREFLHREEAAVKPPARGPGEMHQIYVP